MPVQCSVQCTLYSVHCTVSVHCTAASILSCVFYDQLLELAVTAAFVHSCFKTIKVYCGCNIK